MKKKQTFELDVQEVCEAIVSYIAWENRINPDDYVGAMTLNYNGPDLSGVRVEYLAIEDVLNDNSG